MSDGPPPTASSDAWRAALKQAIAETEAALKAGAEQHVTTTLLAPTARLMADAVETNRRRKAAARRGTTHHFGLSHGHHAPFRRPGVVLQVRDYHSKAKLPSAYFHNAMRGEWEYTCQTDAIEVSGDGGRTWVGPLWSSESAAKAVGDAEDCSCEYEMVEMKTICSPDVEYVRGPLIERCDRCAPPVGPLLRASPVWRGISGETFPAHDAMHLAGRSVRVWLPRSLDLWADYGNVAVSSLDGLEPEAIVTAESVTVGPIRRPLDMSWVDDGEDPMVNARGGPLDRE